MAANQKQSRLKRKAKLAHRKRSFRILTTAKQIDNKKCCGNEQACTRNQRKIILQAKSCRCGRFVQTHYLLGETTIVFKMHESPAKCGRPGRSVYISLNLSGSLDFSNKSPCFNVKLRIPYILHLLIFSAFFNLLFNRIVTFSSIFPFFSIFDATQL